MNVEASDASAGLRERLIDFRDRHIYPNEAEFNRQVADGATRWKPAPLMEELRARARAQGLWNLSMSDRRYGPGLSNAEYAPLAEIMGCNEWTPEVFNCNPPDTGNMGLLAAYGSEEQQQRWLAPLLAGEIRSCFAMTEPGVASSDATNISTEARLEGDSWVINGEKWWISGPGNPACRIAIVMCRTDPHADKHRQHSMILAPLATPGVSVERHLTVFGHDFAPRGHCQLRFDNVRVPADNVLLGSGRGFEIAQGRLGPGRIHHAMRCIGAAERALELMCRRASTRVAFGKPIADLGGNQDSIARSRIEIDMLRAFVLQVAQQLDAVGATAARSAISQVKVAAPEIACRVVDRAMQIHGAAGLSQDTPLAALFARLRTLRIVDGPDEVHLRVVAKAELARYSPQQVGTRT
jgi:acyl-CoA dehydrogenase